MFRMLEETEALKETHTDMGERATSTQTVVLAGNQFFLLLINITMK